MHFFLIKNYYNLLFILFNIINDLIKNITMINFAGTQFFTRILHPNRA